MQEITAQELIDNNYYYQKAYFLRKYAEFDAKMINLRVKARLEINTPLVGDIIIMNNGEKHRIAEVFTSNKIQTAKSGSFYLCIYGDCSMSGALESGIEGITFTGDHDLASIWIFSEDQPGSDRGISAQIPVKVWKQI